MTRSEEKILFTLSWIKIESNRQSSYPVKLLYHCFSNRRTIYKTGGEKWKVSRQINKCNVSKQAQLHCFGWVFFTWCKGICERTDTFLAEAASGGDTISRWAAQGLSLTADGLFVMFHQGKSEMACLSKANEGTASGWSRCDKFVKGSKVLQNNNNDDDNNSNNNDK